MEERIKLPTKYRTKKIVAIVNNYSIPTYDCEVDKTHYYITDDGLVSHNTLSLMFRDLILSYGIEQAFGIYFWKRTRISGKYEYYFCVPNIVRQVFKDAGYEIPIKADAIKDTWDGQLGKPIAKFIDDHINLIGIHFKNAVDIKPEDKLELMAKMMKWIDSSISVTYMLPEKSNWKDVYNFILSAWHKEVKSIAAFPDRKMYGIVSFIPFKDLAFKLKKEGISIHPQNFTQDELDQLHISNDNIVHSSAPKRPKEMEADFYVVKIKNDKFIMAVGLLNGAPYELFGGRMNGNGLDFKFTHKKGIIIKQKSGVYIAQIGEDIEADFSKVFSPIEKSLFRSLSTSLRHGVPVKFIVEQLQKAEDDMFSIASAAARVLKKYIANGEIVTGVQCPQCKLVGTLVYKDGCNECTNCGYSKCGS
jgi:ribonucleoside-diphosphate reductase alpha chain